MGVNLQIRQVNKDDSKTLWHWRNHPLTRQMSLDASEVPWEVHQSWFESVIEDPNRLILIGELASSHAKALAEKRFAMFRLDFMSREPAGEKQQGNKAATVSINLNPDYRGKGLSSPFILSVLDYLKQNVSILPTDISENIIFHAQIKSINMASVKSFEKAQFIADKKGSTQALLHYTLKLALN